MPTYERLDYGSPDGSQWGGSSTEDSIGFFGITPVLRYNLTSLTSAFPASTYPTLVSNLGTSGVGFISSTHMSSMVATLSSIQACLTRYGLMS